MINPKLVHGGISYFFTLSAGIAKVQKTKEANPPDKKLETPVLICSDVMSVLVLSESVTTYFVLSAFQCRKPSHESLHVVRSRTRSRIVDEPLTSNDINIQNMLPRTIKLPVDPVHRPRMPCARTTCRRQSIGPLNWRSKDDLCSCNCRLTEMNWAKMRYRSVLYESVPFRSSTGVATKALFGISLDLS